jgi:peptide/nickel transport system substrate-binding protein
MTFHLRHGLTFHDGSPITSEDCVRSFERLLAKDAIVSKYYDLVEGAGDFQAGKADHVRGLIAQDPLTFVIRLQNKFPPFPAILAGATAKILPKHLVDQPGFFNHPIGAGPFQLITSDEHEIRLERFDHYWHGPAKLKTLTFHVADEPEGMKLASQGKLQDLATYPLNGDEAIFKSGQHLQIPVVATWIIGLNTRIKPFDRKEVREAFRAALSSSDFIKTFYPGQLAAYGYIPPGLPGYMEHPAQPQLTKKIKVTNLIKIVIPQELAKAVEIGRYFEKKFGEAGFNVKADVTSWEELERRYNAKTMQAFVMSMNADYPDVEFLARNFESDNPDNFSGIHSRKIDSLTRQARQIDSRIERSATYEKLAQAIEDEALTVNLLHYRAHYWFGSCVKGIQLNSLGDVYIPYRDIYLSGNCRTNEHAEVER